jgi:hypothetical protein
MLSGKPRERKHVMARHQNDIILAGPVSRVQDRMFGDFGFLEMNLAALKVKFDLKNDQKSEWLKSAAQNARSAVLTSGAFSSSESKKESGRWFYDVKGRVNAVSFFDFEVPIINRAVVVGSVKSASGPWMMIGSRYMIPKREGSPEWRDRYIWVLCQQEAQAYMGHDVLVAGSARPKIESEWRLHIVAEGVWTL